MAKNRTVYIKKKVIIPGVFSNTDRQSITANITFSETCTVIHIRENNQRDEKLLISLVIFMYTST